MLPQCFCKVGTEANAPGPYRLVTDINASFEEQLLHTPVRCQQAVVEVDGVADDQLRKTVALRVSDAWHTAATYPIQNNLTPTV